MKKQLQDICVSLELAKELKEVGYPQESLFYWEQCVDVELACYKVAHITRGVDLGEDDEIICSAPTVTELLDELPRSRDTYEVVKPRQADHESSEWRCFYKDELRLDRTQTDTKLVNALAKMYIYLKKNGLV